MLDIKDTVTSLSITDPPGPLLGWQFLFVVCSLFFLMAALGIYWNFWPLNILNAIRTDRWREKDMSKGQRQRYKFFSFLIYLVGSLVFLSVWVGDVAFGQRVVLNRVDGTAVLYSSVFGDEEKIAAVPLTRLKDAELQYGKGGNATLHLVEDNGDFFAGFNNLYGATEGVTLQRKIDAFIGAKQAEE